MTSTQKVSDLRLVLLGKNGSGKSATGNTILGKKAFEVVDLLKSSYKLCEKQEGVVGGKTISVIDTPGLFNTAVTKHQLMAEIQKCVEMCAPGPDVFLLMLKLGMRFTKEERDTVKWIQESFGDKALCRTIILFTHNDQLKGKPLDEYIKESDHLLETVDSCGGRYHSFNNEDRNSQDQVTELLNKISAIMKTNEMNPYTLDMLKKNEVQTQLANIAQKMLLAIGILGIAKIVGMIATAIAGSAAGEAVEAAATEAAKLAVKTAADAAWSLTEKALETTEAVQTVAEKAFETGEAVQTVVEKVFEATGEAVQTSATGTGLAAQGIVTGLAAAASAGAARAAASAGKVATSGRVSAVAALAAAFGGAAVTFISALKR